MYKSLNAAKVIATTETLCKRIHERFPDANLARVCDELLDVARKAHDRAAWIDRPNYALRAASAFVILALIGAFVLLPIILSAPEGGLGIAEFVTALEAGINIVILGGGGIFFLVTVESRIKRREALKAIHELRALAHVIDMHQMPKDPGRLWDNEPTDTSPRLHLTPFQVTRYLDYCSEMLSIIGKIAALYVQRFHEPVVLEAANDIENLANGLSRKIWQKLTIIQHRRQAD